MSVTEADQVRQSFDERRFKSEINFPVFKKRRLMSRPTPVFLSNSMSLSPQETDVIDLRNTGREKLDCAGDEVVVVVAAERVVIGAIHLIEIQVRSCRACCPTALPLRTPVDLLDQIVDCLRFQSPGRPSLCAPTSMTPIPS